MKTDKKIAEEIYAHLIKKFPLLKWKDKEEILTTLETEVSHFTHPFRNKITELENKAPMSLNSGSE